MITFEQWLDCQEYSKRLALKKRHSDVSDKISWPDFLQQEYERQEGCNHTWRESSGKCPDCGDYEEYMMGKADYQMDRDQDR
jgi:hypothetical protein